MPPQTTTRAARNRTLTLTEQERSTYAQGLLCINEPVSLDSILDKTILGDTLAVLPYLPNAFANLIVADPPYNLDKTFLDLSFSAVNNDEYAQLSLIHI